MLWIVHGILCWHGCIGALGAVPVSPRSAWHEPFARLTRILRTRDALHVVVQEESVAVLALPPALQLALLVGVRDIRHPFPRVGLKFWVLCRWVFTRYAPQVLRVVASGGALGGPHSRLAAAVTVRAGQSVRGVSCVLPGNFAQDALLPVDRFAHSGDLPFVWLQLGATLSLALNPQGVCSQKTHAY